jgi:glycosyltransferase involved in cell wall biosynthesis
MSPSPPQISVILPAYNAAGFLPQAVASIRRQRAERLEIIVVDDGSTDNTAHVVQELGRDIRFLQQANGGAAAARNTGLAAASGTIIAFLDADDLWPENKLARQLPFFVNDPSLGVVQGRSQAEVLETAEGQPEGRRFKAFGEPWHAPLLGSGLFQRWVIDRVGGFDVEFRLGQDMDWFLRLRERGIPGVRIPDVTLRYRLHDSNATRGADPKSRNLLLALRRSLQRRRTGTLDPATPVANWPLVESAS